MASDVVDLFTHVMGSALMAGVGIWVARWGRQRLYSLFAKSKNNQALKLFLINAAYVAVLIIVGIAVLAHLGIPTAPLITILGTSSLAVGFALKDFLANAAAGIALVFQRPFDIGDTVELCGVLGTVESMNLFHVTLKTPSHESVMLANGKLIQEKVVNKAFEGVRRIEWQVTVAYSASLKEAKRLISEIIEKDKRVLKDPAFVVLVDQLGENGVKLVARAWVQQEDFMVVQTDILEQVKLSFEKHRIQIPCSQMDVLLKQPTA